LEKRTINLKELSVEQLKVMAYDQIVAVENSQRILQALNSEIAERANKPPESTEQAEPGKE